MFKTRVFLAFTLCLFAIPSVHGQPAKPKTPADVDYYFTHGMKDLLARLGSSSYVQREKAYQEIEAFGPLALEHLRRMKGTKDAEVNRRIDELIRRAEEKQLAERVLAPKELTLNLDGVPVQQAIAELAKASGYPLQFQGDATTFADRKITLRGKTTFWQAVDQLCEQAGLMGRGEASRSANAVDDFNVFIPGGKKGIKRLPSMPTPAPAPAGPIVLTNRGKEQSLVSYAGAIKTELRITRDARSKELALQFLIHPEPRLAGERLVGTPLHPEPRLAGERLVGTPLLQQIVDGLGRKLAVSLDAPKANYETQYFDRADMALGSVNWFNGGSRSAVIRVKDGEQAAKVLKTLAGKLTMEVDLQNETLARIEKVLDAAGKSADAGNGGRVKVAAVKKLDNGAVEVQVALENFAQNPFGGNIIVNGNGGVIIRGNVIINGGGGGIVIGPNGVRINGAGNGSAKDLPDLVDAKGQKFRVGNVSGDSFSFVNGASSRTATIQYLPNPGQAEPRDLVLFGTRTQTVAVPFRFENVPLP